MHSDRSQQPRGLNQNQSGFKSSGGRIDSLNPIPSNNVSYHGYPQHPSAPQMYTPLHYPPPPHHPPPPQLPPPIVGMAPPVHISLTVNSSQLNQLLHNRRPPDHQYGGPQVDNLYNQGSSHDRPYDVRGRDRHSSSAVYRRRDEADILYEGGAPPSGNYKPALLSHHPHERPPPHESSATRSDTAYFDAPPPYSQTPQKQPHSFQSPHFARDPLLEDYPTDLQRRRGHKNVMVSNVHRTPMGSGCVGSSRRGSLSSSDNLPLGSEASSFCRSQGKKPVCQDNVENDEDNSSVQSMPMWGNSGLNKNKPKGSERGNVKRGQRGIRRGGGVHRFDGLKNQGINSFLSEKEQDEDSDFGSIQSMPVRGKGQGANHAAQGERGRGGRGTGRGGGKKQNPKCHKPDQKDISNVYNLDDDNDDEFDFNNVGRIHFKSSTFSKRGHQGVKRGGRRAGKRGAPHNYQGRTETISGESEQNTPPKTITLGGRTGKKWINKEASPGAESSDEADQGNDHSRSVCCSSEGKTNNKSKYTPSNRGRGKSNNIFSGNKYAPKEKQPCRDEIEDKINISSLPDKSKKFRFGNKNGNCEREEQNAPLLLETDSPAYQQGLVDAASIDQKIHRSLTDKDIKGNKQSKGSKKSDKSTKAEAEYTSNKNSQIYEGCKKAETTVQRLNVSMNFQKLFESTDALKSCVKGALKFPAKGKFELEFNSETLFYKTNTTHCNFVITTSCLWYAKKAVKCMVLHLRQKLKTKIFFTMFVNKGEKKGKSEKNEVINIEKDLQDSKCGGRKEEKETNSGQPEAVSKEGTKQTPPPCPVIFNLSMEKPFASSTGLKTLMEKLIKENTMIEDFSINKDSFLLETKSSHCAICLSSKADAKRLKKTIMKFQKETSVAVSFNITKWEEKNNDEIRVKNWNSQIDQCLKEMEAQTKRVLANHEEKISSLTSQLELLNTDCGAKVGEWNATRDKVVEAERQRKEFQSYCVSISKKMEDLRQDIKLFSKLHELQQRFGVECQRLVNALPIYARRGDITDEVKSHQVSIILGETGSGKSTQIALYLNEAGLATNGLIVCTQPRKVAAVQLAERVAQELVVSVGDLVGYKVGSRRKTKPTTKIVYMTDHSLLNECLEDRNFEKYSCIIVDEAHERSIYTDILLGMIKACLPNRPDLKVVITSATIDPQVFIEYFHCQEELRVSGRTFPVDVAYVDTLDDFENYEVKAVEKAAEIHRHKPEGDILVFLSSPIEIQRCCEEFCKVFEGRTDFKCFPLHGQLVLEEQKKVFAKLDPGVRKIVFSTNCAETSITIDGIKYVIDTGVAKEMRYDPKKNMNLLGVHIISQSSADQRKGRAGRTASGECYRLYSEEGFNKMEAINEPEILRVHLGQAILKLAELGVNIQDYDFVKAPSESALTAAMDTLEYFGAIEDKKITERGRWVSKLPFDPSLGYLVYEGNERNLLYDAVVLASVISNGSGFFYRGLTETEAQITARTKSQFGQDSGDIFTWYAVYKLWKTMPHKEKNTWCRTNCINYKSLNFARQMVEEVVSTLSKEMEVPLMEEFSTDDATLQILSKLVFRANARSICHFMGHSRAGYFYIGTGRQVHMHPSCVLAALNVHPEWLVFTDLVKTSREFIKGVFSVKEDWIREAVSEGYLNIDVNKAKLQTLSVVHLEELGSSSFRSIVGPRFSNLRCLEELCEKTGMQHSILEADRDLGTIAIYSSSPVSQEVVAQLHETKYGTIKTLQDEEKECKIFSKEFSEGSNIRAVLGAGGCVRQVMMPHQTNQVLIWRVSSNNTEEDIVSKFGEFGNILEVVSFKATEPWGFIRYQSISEAAAAVDQTARDETMAGSLRLDKKSKNTANMFEARVSWLRRAVKGQGTAFIKCSFLQKPQLLGRTVYTDNGSREICLSKQERERKDPEDDSGQDLIIFKIGNTSEETIRNEIQRLLGTGTQNIKITIPRERVDAPSNRELEDTKLKLKSLVDPLNKENVSIWLSMPRVTSCYQFGFLNFKDPVRGFSICKKLNNFIHIDGQAVKISPSLKTVILIPKKIKPACQEQMDELFVRMNQDLGVEFEWKKLKENDAIQIKCDNPEGIVKARECINEEIQGQVIDCELVESCRCLMTGAGQDYLKQVQKPTGCVIISDLRTRKVHLYGTAAKCSQAMIEINKYLTENEANAHELFRLKGNGKPPGVMRELMSQFGPLLEGLSSTYNLPNVVIDWRSHTLNCSGPEASMDDLRKFMSSLEQSLCAKHSTRDTGLPDCVVCMVPVESKNEMHRLEACGHAYCLPCLQHQAVVCVQNNQLPLVCAEETCQQELVWKDIHYIISKKWMGKQKLISVALNTCVSCQPEKYKFCPTPNCPVVYEITSDENGCEFNCAVCFASTCSSCHIPFHSGMSCKMVKSATSAERDLDSWRAADPDKRKICPKCKSPIEMTGGCNRMRCNACKTVFCWVCDQVFDDSQKCYAHLAKVHGGIFD